MWFPNPDLRPVRGQSIEVSAQHDFTPDHSAELALYRTDLTDQIGSEDVAPRDVEGKPTAGSRFVNVDKSAIMGADLRLNARLTSDLKAYASASFLDAHLYPGGNVANAMPVADSVPVLGHLGLTYRPWSWLTITPRLAWQSGRATTAANPIFQGATIPGAWLVDLAVRAQLNDHLALQVVGTNLLDQIYYANSEFQTWSMGGQVPQNGRRLQVGLSYAF
jgi:outer membrane receptor protein involved in Fe transport